MRVLIVEPKRSVTRIIGWILEEAGFDVEATDSPDDVERLVEEIRPDVTIVDVTSMDGATNAYVRPIAQRTGVVALTAAGGAAEVPDDVAVVRVPFDAETLLDTIRDVANEGGTQG